MPARRLEPVAPMMTRKGRVQVGADADLTIFNPDEIIDRADFTGLKYSEGIYFVLVNGVLAVRDGKNVENVFPGRAIVGKYKRR